MDVLCNEYFGFSVCECSGFNTCWTEIQIEQCKYSLAMMKLKLCFKNIICFIPEGMGWSASASSSWCHFCSIPNVTVCAEEQCSVALLSLRLPNKFSRGIKLCISAFISIDSIIITINIINIITSGRSPKQFNNCSLKFYSCFYQIT